MKVQGDSYSRWQGVAVALWLALFALQMVVFAAGMGALYERMQQICVEEVTACAQRSQLIPADAQTLLSIGWSLEAHAQYFLLLQVVQKGIAVVVAVLIFWRKPNDHMTWIVSAFLTISIFWPGTEALIAAQPAWTLPARFLSWGGAVSFILFCFLFPSGHFVPRWTRGATVVYSVLLFLSTFFPRTSLDFTDLNQWNQWGLLVLLSLFISALGSQVYRYRYTSSAVERQQTKWVVLAMVVGIAAILASIGAILLSGELGHRVIRYFYLVELGFSLMHYLLPIAIGIAILRYRLFEIDILIRKTLTYALLTGILGALYFGGVVLAQQLFKSTTGQDSDLAIVVSTLLIAALFNPLRHRVQGTIDRYLYRRKYDAEQTLARFNQTLRDEVDVETLKARLLTVVDDTMQPTHLALWVRQTPKS